MSDVSSPPLKPAQPFRVFISYARADEAHLELFNKHLSNLVQQRWIEPWTDRMFRAGDEWREQLTDKLLASDLILMLVSPDFMASEFIRRVELRSALERHAVGQVKLVPIVVRSTHLTGNVLDSLQGLPRNRTPIDLWTNRDQAWLDVVKGLEEVLVQPLEGQLPPAPEVELPQPPADLTPRYANEALLNADQELAQARVELRRLEQQDGRQELLEAQRQKVARLKQIMRDGEILVPGMVLDDRFQLLEIIGEGSFSTVWKAADRDSGRPVALKLFKREILLSPTSRSRTETGVKAMLLLRHPHIVLLLEPRDVERNAPQQRKPQEYVVMELASSDFHRYIHGKKPGMGEVLRIVHETALALEYAHAHRCWHRDVKPHNILLTETGSARLTDFDHARLGDSLHGSKAGAVGTPLYQAPELVRHLRKHGEGNGFPANAQLDVYSLSVTLLTALRREEPYLLPEVVEDDLAMPDELRTLLKTGLSALPEHRHTSMRHFREALEAAIEAHLSREQNGVQALAEASDWSQAVAGLEDLLTGFGWWEKGAARLASLWSVWLERLSRVENYAQALWLAERAAQAFPDARAWSEERTRLEGQQRVAQDYTRAMEALKAGRAVEARQLLLEVLRRRPDDKDSAQQLFIALSGVDPEQLKGELVAADQRVGSLAQQVSRLEGEVARLKSEGQRLQVGLSEKDGTLQKQSGALKTLHEELATTQGKLTAAEQALDRMKKSLSTAMTEQENLKRATSASLAEAKQEKAAEEEAASQARTRAEQADASRAQAEKALAVEKASRTQAEADRQGARAVSLLLSLGLVGSLGLSGYLWLSRPTVVAQAEPPVVQSTPLSRPAPTQKPAATVAPADIRTHLPGSNEYITWLSIPGTGPDGFMMGSPDKEGVPYEHPRHKVTVPAFQMSKTEVTNVQYNACVAAGKCSAPGWDKCVTLIDGTWKEGKAPDSLKGDNQPVVCVDWFQARAYAAWVSEVSGQCVRLPTEAEWEYVGTGGGKTKYAGTDDLSKICEYGNVADKSGKDKFNFTNTVDCKDGYAETAPVERFKDGAWGLKDLTGNVWEWTEDCYHDSYKEAPSDGSAWLTGCQESDKDALRVVRGGAWHSAPGWLRSSVRDWVGAWGRSADRGFRLAAVSSPPCHGLQGP